jgi:hypothetical protein
MKAAVASAAGKMVGAYIGGTSLAKVCHGGVQLWPDDLWKVSVLRFASDVRTAAMTHAIWRGSVSFDIGGVSYVHGRNMQIADDGMSLAFTGDDRPTYRDVAAALGESMVLNATLHAEQKDYLEGHWIEEVSSCYRLRMIVPYPLAPCYVAYYARSRNAPNGITYISSTIYKNTFSDDTRIARNKIQVWGNWHEVWDNYDLWTEFNTTLGVSIVYKELSWAYVRFKEFSYAKQYNVIGID